MKRLISSRIQNNHTKLSENKHGLTNLSRLLIGCLDIFLKFHPDFSPKTFPLMTMQRQMTSKFDGTLLGIKHKD